MTMDKEINGYQWNSQIIKWIMYQNKKSGNDVVPWQQIIVRYHGNNVNAQKWIQNLSHVYQRSWQKSNNIL